jgi:protein-disulfide isomerase
VSNRRKRDERQTRAAQMRREREHAATRRTRLITGAIVAVAIVIIVAAGVAIFAAQRDTGRAPDGVTSDNGYLVTAEGLGSDTAASTASPVKVVFYEDFQCPICEKFETQVAAYVDQAIMSNEISVEYRPIAILDQESSTKYSTRSAAAAACVFDDAGIGAFYRFHSLLFHNQPEEGSVGLSDSELANFAERAGAGGASSCIEGDDYEGWVAEATDQASRDNINATPTVLVAGKEVTSSEGGPPQVQDLVSAVAAASGTGLPSESPSEQ